jgi:hypothetical protein
MSVERGLWGFRNEKKDNLVICEDHLKLTIYPGQISWPIEANGNGNTKIIPISTVQVNYKRVNFFRLGSLNITDNSKKEYIFFKSEAAQVKDKTGKIGTRPWKEAAEIIMQTKIKYEKKIKQGTNVHGNIHYGNQITSTEIKDSVLNRSNVGGGSSKMQELEKLTEMKKEGLIDDDEFKQMKKEILGK